MTQVIKRDGTRTEFDPAKVSRSVEAACKDCGTEEERARELSSAISEKIQQAVAEMDEVESQKIRELALAELEQSHADAAEAWRKYDETKASRQQE